jgi:peptidyl-prolyl cis-trans isomerase B (cyclophilin B)
MMDKMLMTAFTLAAGVFLLGVTSASAQDVPRKPEPAAKPIVIIDTSLGSIKAELWPDKAPATVANFLGYLKDGFFDGLIFHRVISGFMIQGGGFTPSMQKKQTKAPIKNEARSDTPNKRGTLAMARTSQIDSATAQFFINLVDNSFLNHRDNSVRGFGYCVFGKVTSGMDVVDKIGKVKTGRSGPYGDVPTTPVVIKSIKPAE